MKKGVTRLVFLVGRFAIKIPNFTYSWQNFLEGCLANCKEGNFCKQWKSMPELNLVAKTYFSSWFGLVNIQERVDQLDNPIWHVDTWCDERFKGICSDIKNENFGVNKKGQVVCLDYAV